MALINKIPAILKYIEKHQKKLDDNQIIFNILEGDVLTQVYNAIDQQLSGSSAQVSKQRAVPINILRKVVDKQTSIYAESPERTTDLPKDLELMESYEQSLDINDQFNTVNESFNAYKYGVEEIYYEESTKEVKTRTVATNLFLPYGDDLNNPLKVTEMIKIMGSYRKTVGAAVKNAAIYHIYSDDEFIIIDEDGSVLYDQMAEYGIDDGVNPYGVIPFSYVSRSKYLLVPLTDTDQIAMSILVPLLMTELNYGMTFLCNPIIYGVDVDVKNLQVAPNTFWSVSSDGSSENKGELKVLQPNMNIPNQSNWIMEQTAVWLETKNIKANHLVNVNGSESISSGIALIIREMDTTEDKRKQTKYFQTFESDFWRRLAKIHNYLAASSMLKDNTKFSDDFDVRVSFNVNQVIETTEAVWTRVNAAYAAGTISKERALMELYPEWSEEQLEEELARNTITLPTVSEE